MTDLKQLKALAEKATHGIEEWDTNLPATDKWKNMSEQNAAFIRKANPQVILSLIQSVEELEEALGKTTEASNVYLSALGRCRLLDPINFTKEQLVAHIKFQNDFVNQAFKDAPRWNFQTEALTNHRERFK